MELIPGDSMHVVLWREKKLPLEMVLPFMADVLHGLRDLHASGIVHRDLKPGNIVLRPMPNARPRATLIDFGVSRIIAGADEEEVTAITRGDRVLGTLEYMAPEQILSSRAVTFTADLYALGALAFKALVGAHVFGDLTEGKLAMAKLNQDAPPLRLEREDVLARLTASFVGRLLARRSRERFASTEEALGEAMRLVAFMSQAQPSSFDDDQDDAATMIVDPGELAIPLGYRGPTPKSAPAAAPASAPAPRAPMATLPTAIIAAPPPAPPPEPPPPRPVPVVAQARAAADESAPSSRSPRLPPPLPVGPAPSAPPRAPLPTEVIPPASGRPAPRADAAGSAPPPSSARPAAQPAPAPSGRPAPSSRTPWTEEPPSSPRPRRPARRRARWRTPVVVVASLTLGVVGGGFFSRSYAEGGTAARWVESLRTLIGGHGDGDPGGQPAPAAPGTANPATAGTAEPPASAATAASAEPSVSAGPGLALNPGATAGATVVPAPPPPHGGHASAGGPRPAATATAAAGTGTSTTAPATPKASAAPPPTAASDPLSPSSL
jgi:eukaryotic-like serine/threonine-protein kinase